MKSSTTTRDKKTAKEPTTGILMMAVGHPFYARMAYNLLVSIRYHDKTIPVAILIDGPGFGMLDPDYQKAFNHVIPISVGSDVYAGKLQLDIHSPFDRTLFLDVDTIWGPHKAPKQLLAELAGKEFQCVIRARKATDSEEKITSQWFKLSDVKEAYGFEAVYDISSELIYFEGQPKVFKTARKIYADPKIEIGKFGNGLPDEAFFILALEAEKMELKTPFEPTYWEPAKYPHQHSREYIQNHWILSVGGAFYTQHIKRIYDSLLDMYFYHSGMAGTPFQLQAKSNIFPERRKI